MILGRVEAHKGQDVKAFLTCAENKVPKDKRTAVEKRLASAAFADKVYKRGDTAGRTKLMEADGPVCVANGLPPSGSAVIPGTTPVPVGSHT